ncbi:fagellar hook-basal body protein [Aminomonas paucivorans DSM 12260]|uniref:Flagellar hook protein FlgE n=2 Tax=Aminomonas TaxID=81411 RepID=E3CVT2_9BACT|nr:fagellar hook-basal body protein [Aminomonas paucivorans DSM 12260]
MMRSQKSLYTRAGATTLDGDGNMVMSGTGYMYQGYKMEIDPADPTKYIKGGTLEAVNIPVGQKLEAQATKMAAFRCNLDSRVPPYLPFGFPWQAEPTARLNGTNIQVSFVNNAPPVPGSLVEIAGITAPDGGTVTIAGGPIRLEMTAVNTDSEKPTMSLVGTPTVTIVSDDTPPVTEVYDVAYTNGNLVFTGQTNGEAWSYPVDASMTYDSFSVSKTTAPNAGDYNILVDFGEKTGNTMPLYLLIDNGTPPPSVAEYTVTLNDDGTFASVTQVTGPVFAGLTVDITDNKYGVNFKFRDSAPGAQQVTALTVSQKISSTHSTKLDVYDTLGNPHTLEVVWSKVAPNRWDWNAFFPSEPTLVLSGTNGRGTLVFDTAGKITSGGTADLRVPFSVIGAEDSVIKLDFDGTGMDKELIDGVTQYGSGFTTKGYYQDGYAMGVLEDYAVSADGTVSGVYSNGKNQPLYQVALALFANPQGLVKEGDTVFSESANSGMAQVMTPMEGGAGKIMGSNLEMANVDLSQEFVNLIVAQRGFQANARVITTSDQVLEELINLKR